VEKRQKIIQLTAIKMLKYLPTSYIYQLIHSLPPQGSIHYIYRCKSSTNIFSTAGSFHYLRLTLSLDNNSIVNSGDFTSL